MKELYTTLLGGCTLFVCPASAVANDQVILVQEHFDKFTRGSEDRPDTNDMCLEELGWCIKPTLTETEGWCGGGIYQAGGCAYIYAYNEPIAPDVWYLGYLESPHFDATPSQGEFRVRFRARSVLEEDWLGVCGVPTNPKEAQQKFAVISDKWTTYEVSLGCGDDFTSVQFEPLTDGCFIDDIVIYYETYSGPDVPLFALETPVALPVEDFTPEGYTARWQGVAGAEDYAVYDYLYYTAQRDGDTFDYINTDFSLLDKGSLDQPATIPGTIMGMAYLDEYTGRSDWSVFGAGQAAGCLAFKHETGIMGSGINSPALRIADTSAPLYVSFRAMSPTVSDLLFTAYNEGDHKVKEEIVACSDEWTTCQIRIDHPSETLTLYLEVEYGEPGYYYIDDLRVWQDLPAGTVAHVSASYHETADTSVYIETPATPEGYRHAFSVSAYAYERDEEGDVIDYEMSAWSAPVFADGGEPEGIANIYYSANEHPSFGGAEGGLYLLDGRPAPATWSSAPSIRIDATGRKRIH